MVRCSRCSEPCEWSEGLFVSVQDVGRPVSDKLRLCARCGGMLRVWLEDGREGMPGAERVEHGLFEDHVEGEGNDLDELMAEGRSIGHLPKHPTVTESRTDRSSTLETAADGPSRSPRVASKSWYLLPTWSEELYGWSGLSD